MNRVTWCGCQRRSIAAHCLIHFKDVPGRNTSAETPLRVLQTAPETGAVPDAAAQTSTSDRTRTVGFLIRRAHHITVDASIPQALYSLNDVCRHNDFHLLIETVEDVSNPDAYVELAQAKHIEQVVRRTPHVNDSQWPTLKEQQNMFLFGVLASPVRA